jgi:hypothetical protein
MNPNTAIDAASNPAPVAKSLAIEATRNIARA